MSKNIRHDIPKKNINIKNVRFSSLNVCKCLEMSDLKNFSSSKHPYMPVINFFFIKIYLQKLSSNCQVILEKSSQLFW